MQLINMWKKFKSKNLAMGGSNLVQAVTEWVSAIQGCRQGGAGGLKPPQNFNSCYFTAKEP